LRLFGGPMRLLLTITLAFSLGACAGGFQQGPRSAAEIDWPEDPAVRLVAEEWFGKAATEASRDFPPGLDFAYRDIEGTTLSDHYVHSLKGLSSFQLKRLIKTRSIDDFYNTERVRICNDPTARFLLDNGYRYAFNLQIMGRQKLQTSRKEFAKGFCVANDLPLVNQAAVDARYTLRRRWPNGDPVDIRITEKLTGLFRLMSSKFEDAELPEKTYQITDIDADGLMISFNLSHQAKKGRTLNAYWLQVAKGKSLKNLCTKPSRLIALTVGAVYAYNIEITSKKGIDEASTFTVTYPDCLLYNRK